MYENDKETLKSILEKLEKYMHELNNIFEEVEKIRLKSEIITLKNGKRVDIFGLRCNLLEVVSYGNDAMSDLKEILKDD